MCTAACLLQNLCREHPTENYTTFDYATGRKTLWTKWSKSKRHLRVKLCNHVINRFEPSVSIWRVRPQNFHQFQLSSICSSLYYLRLGFRGNHGRVFIPDEIRQHCLWSGSESNLGMWIARIINCIIWKSERDESIISCWVWC